MHPVFANNCHNTRVSRVDALSRLVEKSQERTIFHTRGGSPFGEASEER